MRLEPTTRSDITLGQIVVLQNRGRRGALEMRLIEAIDDEAVHLAVLSPLIEEDAAPEIVPFDAIASRLLVPIFEIGDRVRIHGRPGRICETAPNDLHVRVRLDQTPEQTIYTNIVLLDFQEQLKQTSEERQTTAH